MFEAVTVKLNVPASSTVPLSDQSGFPNWFLVPVGMTAWKE